MEDHRLWVTKRNQTLTGSLSRGLCRASPCGLNKPNITPDPFTSSPADGCPNHLISEGPLIFQIVRLCAWKGVFRFVFTQLHPCDRDVWTGSAHLQEKKAPWCFLRSSRDRWKLPCFICWQCFMEKAANKWFLWNFFGFVSYKNRAARQINLTGEIWSDIWSQSWGAEPSSTPAYLVQAEYNMSGLISLLSSTVGEWW